MTSLYSRVIVLADGRCVVPGLDFEGRKVTVHHRTASHLVLHITGGSGWSGVGMRSYTPAKFIVLAIKKAGRKQAGYLGQVGEELHTTDVVEFDLRREVRP